MHVFVVSQQSGTLHCVAQALYGQIKHLDTYKNELSYICAHYHTRRRTAAPFARPVLSGRRCSVRRAAVGRSGLRVVAYLAEHAPVKYSEMTLGASCERALPGDCSHCHPAPL